MANFDGNVDKKINDKFEIIEDKLRNSFQSMKADMDSIKQRIVQSSQKPLNEQSNEVRREIEFLKEKISAKLGDINSQISEVKEQQETLASRRNMEKPRDNTELRELSRQISSLKEQIASKDDLDTLKIIFEDKIQNLKRQLSKTGLKDEIYSELDTKISEKLSSYDETISSHKTQSEKERKETITRVEKEKEEAIKKLEQEKKELIATANKNTQKIIEDTKAEVAGIKKDISDNTKDINKKLEARDQQIYTLQRQISYLKSKVKDTQVLPAYRSQTEEQAVKASVEANESEEVSIPLSQRIKDKFSSDSGSVTPEFEKPKRDKKKLLAIGVSILIVVIIVAAIILFVNPLIKAKYSPFDVVVSNSTGMPMSIYYNQNKIGMTVSGWESKLIYDSKEDRVAGNNVTGWFSPNSTISIGENIAGSKKLVNAEISNGADGVLIAGYNYTFFKNKPYFKTQFYANTLNNNKLDLAAYGLVISGSDILLPNGTVLKNDNNITTVNGTIIRKGSTYKVDSAWYEIFYNQNTSKAIVVYSPQAFRFVNLFTWNVYQLYTTGTNGTYKPVYFMIFENSTFTFNEELSRYYVGSNQYTGNLDSYIKDSVSFMDS